MNTDSYFTIGGPHISACEPCQDYALSGVLANGVAYALVSDGSSCAGSGMHKGQTDIGSRLIAHAFVFAIKYFSSYEVVNAILSGEVFQVMTEQLSKTRYTDNENDLLATLVAVVSDGTMAATLCIGDGVIAKTFNNGKLDITELVWNASTPYYFAYSMLGRDDQFIEHHNAISNNETSFTACKTIISDGEVTTTDTKFSAKEIVTSPFVDSFLISDLKSITVFSDGISQMQGDLPLTELVKKFTGFKSTKGRFISRRVHSALTKDFSEPPKDDFSAAGIWLRD